jgi:hypothetical protein
MLEEAGFSVKWETRAKLGVAQNLRAKGWGPQEVAEVTELDLKTVKKLYAKK